MTAYRIVIPARLGSTRLPRKPLLDLGGQPVIVRVCEAASRAAATEIVVATDSPEIDEVVRERGYDVQLTSPDHESGTDRLAEVVDRRGWPDDAVVVNLQGDEPGIPAPLLDAAAELLHTHRAAGIATFATPIHTADELFDPSVVKVVGSSDGYALYFSRAPVPWTRDAFADGRPPSLPPGVPFLRHLGLYAYRVATLRRFAKLGPTALERAEKLEQLRALTAGIRIALGHIEQPPGHGIDTPADLERVRELYRGACNGG